MRRIMLALALIAPVGFGPVFAVAADCSGYAGPGPCSAAGGSFDGLAGLAAGPSNSDNVSRDGARPTGLDGSDYGLGGLTSGSGGQAYGGPGSACYAGPGGPCYPGPGGSARACPAGCR